MNEELKADYIELFMEGIVTICERLQRSKYYFLREYWNALLCLLLSIY